MFDMHLSACATIYDEKQQDAPAALASCRRCEDKPAANRNRRRAADPICSGVLPSYFRQLLQPAGAAHIMKPVQVPRRHVPNIWNKLPVRHSDPARTVYAPYSMHTAKQCSTLVTGP
jgi:hypothetical protein